LGVAAPTLLRLADGEKAGKHRKEWGGIMGNCPCPGEKEEEEGFPKGLGPSGSWNGRPFTRCTDSGLARPWTKALWTRAGAVWGRSVIRKEGSLAVYPVL
jgi:hypothetical protein